MLGLIGEGGMGEVWSVQDTRLHRVLALKVIRPELAHQSAAVARFVAEARATAALEHGGVAPVHELGQLDDGRPYYTMKLLHGRTLDVEATAARGTPDALPLFVDRMIAVCDCLAYAHSRGVVHRDIKPANVLVGDFGEVTVLDWGLVKVAAGEDPPSEAHAVVRGGEFATRGGTCVGTPGFMSPEQRLGLAVDARADVYALACTLVALRTGEPPAFPATRSARVVDLPPALADLCLRALARNAADRPADAGSFGAELLGWLQGARREVRRNEQAVAAERLWSGFSAPQQSMCRELLLRLLDDNAEPRAEERALFHELDEGAGAVVEALLGAGLVAEAGTRLQIADGELPVIWPRFAAWIAAERAALGLRGRIRELSALWTRAERASAALPGEAQLVGIEAWVATSNPILTTRERACIEAGRASIVRARRRRAFALGLGFAGAVGAAAAFALLYRQADSAEGRAVHAGVAAEARALLARGRELAALHRPHEALALFAAAAELGDSASLMDIQGIASEGVWSRVIPAHASAAWEATWSPSGLSLYSGGADGYAREFDTAT